MKRLSWGIVALVLLAPAGCGDGDSGDGTEVVEVPAGSFDGAAIEESDVNLALEGALDEEASAAGYDTYSEAVGDPEAITPDLTTDCPDEVASELDCTVSGDATGTVTVSVDEDDPEDLTVEGSLEAPFGTVDVYEGGVPIDG